MFGKSEIEWRIELKVHLERASAEELEERLARIPQVIRRTFPERTIENIYFDTYDRRALHDAIEGEEHRQKIRIRRYSHASGVSSLFLERKNKHGDIFRKTRIGLSAGVGLADLLDVYGTFDPMRFPALVSHFRTPPLIAFVANRYKRHYFETLDGWVRCTLDSDLTGHALGAGSRCAWPGDDCGLCIPGVVFELKAGLGRSEEMSRVLAELGMRRMRFSKYVAVCRRAGPRGGGVPRREQDPGPHSV